MAEPPLLLKPAGVRLRFLIDEGVANAVGRVLERRGHDVVYGNTSLARGSADQLVCVAALHDGAILIAADNDMRGIAKGVGIGNHRFKSLSLLKLSCRAPEAAITVEAALSVIEHEWQCGLERVGRRLWIELQRSVIRIVRSVEPIS